MSGKSFMNTYELGEIIRRHELANDGNPLRDIDVLNAMYASLDDIPKLLEEVNELNNRLVKAERLLADAHDVLDDMYAYDMEIYDDITDYFENHEPITRRDE